jgi:gamma-tubulin complex component 2
MSSSSHARISSRSERRSATDNGSSQPRASAGLNREGSKSDRTDSRTTQTPQATTPLPSHRRVPSGVQRTSKNVEERKAERVQIQTREVLTSRTRSPERRSAPQAQAERQRPVEQNKSYGPNARSKPQVDPPAGMIFTDMMESTTNLNSAMESRGLFSTIHYRSFGI